MLIVLNDDDDDVVVLPGTLCDVVVRVIPLPINTAQVQRKRQEETSKTVPWLRCRSRRATRRVRPMITLTITQRRTRTKMTQMTTAKRTTRARRTIRPITTRRTNRTRTIPKNTTICFLFTVLVVLRSIPS